MAPSTTRRKPGGRGARFPQEAADIMLSYYHNVSTFPDEAERVELAKKVKSAAPSCGHYTAYHVYQYFANLRHRAKNGIEPSLPSDAAVAAAKALDAPRCEETRPSVKTKDLQKKRVDDRKTTRDAKSHMLCGARKRSRGIVATEGGDDSPISPVLPRGATTSPDAVNREHPSPKTSNRPAPTRATAPSSPSLSTGQDDGPRIGIELPASKGEGEPPCLITQLHLALAHSNATPDRHCPREPPPKSFAELATWLSERRSTVATRLDSAP